MSFWNSNEEEHLKEVAFVTNRVLSTYEKLGNLRLPALLMSIGLGILVNSVIQYMHF